MTDGYIYMDYAATAWKKPPAVTDAVRHALERASGNPGRGGHAVSLAADRLVENARGELARLIHAGRTEQIVFTSSATDALNTAILGMARSVAASGIPFERTHVICSSMEHNSVARPLEYVRRLGADITVLPADINHGVDPGQVRRAVSRDTRLVVMNGVSNVTGTVNAVEEIGDICRLAGIPYLVDASQWVGMFPMDVEKMHIDLLAFPGHKGLLGPQGTGALYVRSGLSLEPLRMGGTGTYSELLTQPETLPDRYESGTLNVPGIAGLGVGAKTVMEEGVETIGRRESEMAEYLAGELRRIPGVTVFAPEKGCERGAVLSFRIEGQEPQDAAMILDQEFGIAVRAGLHCAPLMHRAIGTLKKGGTIRISPGYYTTWEEAEKTLRAVRELAG